MTEKVKKKKKQYVLVRSYCYNKIPKITKLIHHRNVFLLVLKPGKSKIQLPPDSVCGEDLPRAVHYRRGKRASSVLFFRKGTHPTCEVRDLMTSLLPKGPTSFSFGGELRYWGLNSGPLTC
jgi:hypothetical protein